MTEKKKEICICIFTGLFSILIFCIVVNIWNMNLNIPFVYAGDLSGLLINIKTVLREESWWNFTGLGAPFHTNMWRQMMDGYIPNAFIFTFSKITQSVGLGVNLYYIVSYGLSSMCAYYMLRKSDIKRIFAITGSVLYALIPGHFLRNEVHLYVGSCFSIPLIIVTAMNLYKGNMCNSQYVTKQKLTIKELLKSNSSDQNLGLFFFSVVSFSTIYYGIFSLMLLTFCAVYCSVTRKEWRHLYYYLEYVFVELICIFFIYIPQILANYFDPCIEKIEISTRSLGETEYYAGKLIQYILPISGHRISFLADLRNLYDTSFPLINENGLSSLGLIMSLGFLTGILVCFFHREKLFASIEMYGHFEFFMLLVSTLGGLSAIVGMINHNIRCYNRFSFLIGAVGIIISMKLLQELCLWIIRKVGNTQHIINCIICICVVVVGILDQTTVGMAYTSDYGTYVEQKFNDDLKFVSEIESFEGSNANILVFPIKNAWQAAMGFTKDGHFTEYTEQMLFIQSNTSNWSTGSKAGEAGERWSDWLETLDEKTQAEIAAVVGFSGIAIYYGGYEPEKLNVILSELDELLGKPVAVNDGGSWAYYSISRVRDDLLSNYTEKELEELRNKYLYNYNSWHRYNHLTLATTSAHQTNDKLITLAKDTCQYGPYNSFEAGHYTVEVYGKNLDMATFDCCSEYGSIIFDITFEECNGNYVRYNVSFNSPADAVEFRTFNATDSIVTVEKIETNKIN